MLALVQDIFRQVLNVLDGQIVRLSRICVKTVVCCFQTSQNKSGHPIKLARVPAGEGQYRLRSGRFRFRYDIAGREVVLLYCGLRREDTY